MTIKKRKLIMHAGKEILVCGFFCAALAVALGAFGAHGLKSKLSVEMMGIYQTGVQYHFYHALGLIGIGLLAQRLSDASLAYWAGGLMAAGLFLFSGSLYVLSLSGIRWLGAITPFGGVAFIAAWVLAVIAAWRG